MRKNTWLGTGLVVLGAAMAACALLGPFVFDVIDYRTSDTTLNQIIGADAAILILVAPVTTAVGVLVLRRRPGAALLGLAPAVFAAYTYTQLIVGNEYGDEPGNVEHVFPLLLRVFVLSAALAVTAWRVTTDDAMPDPSRRADRIAGVVFLLLAAFLLAGLHLPSYADALSEQPTNVGNLSSPTAFWLVKFMDLGIVAPAALW